MQLYDLYYSKEDRARLHLQDNGQISWEVTLEWQGFREDDAEQRRAFERALGVAGYPEYLLLSGDFAGYTLQRRRERSE
jgi:hypothetical protein